MSSFYNKLGWLTLGLHLAVVPIVLRGSLVRMSWMLQPLASMGCLLVTRSRPAWSMWCLAAILALDYSVNLAIRQSLLVFLPIDERKALQSLLSLFLPSVAGGILGALAFLTSGLGSLPIFIVLVALCLTWIATCFRWLLKLPIELRMRRPTELPPLDA